MKIDIKRKDGSTTQTDAAVLSVLTTLTGLTDTDLVEAAGDVALAAVSGCIKQAYPDAQVDLSGVFYKWEYNIHTGRWTFVCCPTLTAEIDDGGASPIVVHVAVNETPSP